MIVLLGSSRNEMKNKFECFFTFVRQRTRFGRSIKGEDLMQTHVRIRKVGQRPGWPACSRRREEADGRLEHVRQATGFVAAYRVEGDAVLRAPAGAGKLMSTNILLFFDFVAQPTGFVAQYIVMKAISSELVVTQAENRPSVPSLPLTTLISLPRSPLPRLDQSSQIKVDKGGSNQIKPKHFFPAQSR